MFMINFYVELIERFVASAIHGLAAFACSVIVLYRRFGSWMSFFLLLLFVWLVLCGIWGWYSSNSWKLTQKYQLSILCFQWFFIYRIVSINRQFFQSVNFLVILWSIFVNNVIFRPIIIKITSFDPIYLRKIIQNRRIPYFYE